MRQLVDTSGWAASRGQPSWAHLLPWPLGPPLRSGHLDPPASALRPPPFTLPTNPARPAHCPSPLRRAYPSPRTTATRHPTIDRRGCPLPLRSVLAEVLPVATELLLYSPECADNAADVLRSVCDAIPYHEDTAALQQAFLESYPSP